MAMDNLNSYLAQKKFPGEMAANFREYFMACKQHFYNVHNVEVLSKLSKNNRHVAARQEFGSLVFKFFQRDFCPFLKTKYWPFLDSQSDMEEENFLAFWSEFYPAERQLMLECLADRVRRATLTPKIRIGDGDSDEDEDDFANEDSSICKNDTEASALAAAPSFLARTYDMLSNMSNVGSGGQESGLSFAAKLFLKDMRSLRQMEMQQGHHMSEVCYNILREVDRLIPEIAMVIRSPSLFIVHSFVDSSRALSQCFESELFSPREEIFTNLTNNDELYFLMTGVAVVTDPNAFRVCGTNDVVGEAVVLRLMAQTPRPHMQTAIAISRW